MIARELAGWISGGVVLMLAIPAAWLWSYLLGQLGVEVAFFHVYVMIILWMLAAQAAQERIRRRLEGGRRWQR